MDEADEAQIARNQRLVKKYLSQWRYGVHWAVQATALHAWLRDKLTITVNGLNNLVKLPDDRAFIIMANHNSHFDAPLVIDSLPTEIGARVAVGAASDYFFKNYLQSKPTRILLNTYPIDRAGESKYRGLSEELVRQGVPILVFPEGTRSRTGELGVFHQGLARIALSQNVPILPVAITGTHDAWSAGSKTWTRGRPSVTVNFLPIIAPDTYETAEQLTDRVRADISANLPANR